VRVVYVSTLPHGGPVSHLRDLVPAVADAGIDVHVICGTATVAAEFEERQISTTVVAIESKLDLAGASGLWRHLAGADLVHTHDRRAGLFGRLAARARGARVVHTLHGIPERVGLELGGPSAPPTLGDSGRLRAEALLARLGLVVIPSQALADLVVRHGFPADRIRLVPSGVAVETTTPAPRRHPPVIGTAATLDHHKGIDVLLEACALMTQPVRVEIFGEGPAREQLEALAARLEVAATFHGFVDSYRTRIAELDLFVLPTRGDNLPVAILEAMAHAVPVVATRVGGIPELIVDGESGILVPPDDPAALAGACERMLTSEEVRTTLAEGGARRVERCFSLPDVARRMVAVYEEAAQA
jgi:glycosyltransferase involved in cell wall biosynthesis